MRKFAFSIVAILALSTAACKCSPAARQAADEIEDSHKIVLKEYAGYVEKDASLDAEKKARRKALVESLERLTRKLKEALNE